MSKNKKSLNAIATQLLGKNPELTTIITDNPGSSYKALEPRITSKLCAGIGRSEGQFIKRNDLIWACINEVDGEEDELDY